MFDISWGKLVIIGVVALIVIGPKELPGVLRQLGQWMTRIRRMASEFQGQFNDAMREAEMADLKKTFDETTSSLQSTVSSMTSSLDPTGFKNDMEKLINDPPTGAEPSATSTPATPPSDPAAPVATPATNTPEATPPTDPVALGTAPVAPSIDVPMPELPPPVEQKDFAPEPSPPASAPSSPAPKPEGGKAA
jgi:sec-independent protein translocase protein TatB